MVPVLTGAITKKNSPNVTWSTGARLTLWLYCFASIPRGTPLMYNNGKFMGFIVSGNGVMESTHLLIRNEKDGCFIGDTEGPLKSTLCIVSVHWRYRNWLNEQKSSNIALIYYIINALSTYNIFTCLLFVLVGKKWPKKSQENQIDQKQQVHRSTISGIFTQS